MNFYFLNKIRAFRVPIRLTNEFVLLEQVNSRILLDLKSSPKGNGNQELEPMEQPCSTMEDVTSNQRYRRGIDLPFPYPRDRSILIPEDSDHLMVQRHVVDITSLDPDEHYIVEEIPNTCN